MLSWALVVSTYRREHILPRCLKLAAEETRPPAEIIVIDASPRWDETRERVLALLAPRHPRIRWEYERANVQSLTTQRNQGVRLATADVVFLIDDDSLMYPDCAAEIMRVYEADTGRAVVGVNASHVPEPPDRPDDPEALHPSVHSGTLRHGPIASLVRRALRTDDIFVPYDDDFPRHPMPETLAGLSVTPWRCAAGWGMTFRREVCLKEPFADILIRYAAGEDSDMGYRASRHGLYLGAEAARLCHLGAQGGRIPAFAHAALGDMNPLVLHRLHGTCQGRSMERSKKLLRRRLLINFCKDVYRGYRQFPLTRGTLTAMRMCDEIFAKSEPELREWYPALQREVIERYASA
jgi:glycosyltransferase involved in cell wall biosynthesis